MLSVVMLSVVMLSVVMLNVVLLSVVMLNVLAPYFSIVFALKWIESRSTLNFLIFINNSSLECVCSTTKFNKKLSFLFHSGKCYKTPNSENIIAISFMESLGKLSFKTRQANKFKVLLAKVTLRKRCLKLYQQLIKLCVAIITMFVQSLLGFPR
jgi:hypothetical protein